MAESIIDISTMTSTARFIQVRKEWGGVEDWD